MKVMVVYFVCIGIYTLARSHDHGSMPKSEIADASTLTLMYWDRF